MSDLPEWLRPVAELPERLTQMDISGVKPPPGGGRQSAVLILFGEDDHGPDLLLIERSHNLRSHAGQPAFPGGAVDPEDGRPEQTALREAQEETGLDPAGVRVLGTLPSIYLPPSGFEVTPVLAWWREPSEVYAADPNEVAAVHRVPIAELVDPANRLQIKAPIGYIAPAFKVRGMLVWGFTAMMLDRLLHHVGWERPWDHDRVEGLPGGVIRAALRTYLRSNRRPPDIPE